MTDILMITNGAAGGSEQPDVEKAAKVLRASYTVQVVRSRDAEELDSLLRAHTGVRTVVAVGGDGSLHALAASLRRLEMLGDVRVGLVPMGTGNDFARTVGLATDPGDAALQLLSAEPRGIDLLVDDDDGVVINAVHVGLGAEAGVSAKRWKKMLGPVGYAVGAVISGFTQPGLHVSVSVDGEPVRPRGKVMQVAVGNAAYVGGGALLLPDADPADGLLDVAVSFANPPQRRLAYLAQLRLGRHVKRADVKFVRGTCVQISGEPFRCNADGEIGPLVGGRSWRVEPGAVTMLLPRG